MLLGQFQNCEPELRLTIEECDRNETRTFLERQHELESFPLKVKQIHNPMELRVGKRLDFGCNVGENGQLKYNNHSQGRMASLGTRAICRLGMFENLLGVFLNKHVIIALFAILALVILS